MYMWLLLLFLLFFFFQYEANVQFLLFILQLKNASFVIARIWPFPFALSIVNEWKSSKMEMVGPIQTF